MYNIGILEVVNMLKLFISTYNELIQIGLFKDNNYKIVNEPQDADIIVVNTCGFIESAKEEAINTILEMAEYKKRRCKYLLSIRPHSGNPVNAA